MELKVNHVKIIKKKAHHKPHMHYFSSSVVNWKIMKEVDQLPLYSRWTNSFCIVLFSLIFYWVFEVYSVNA